MTFTKYSLVMALLFFTILSVMGSLVVRRTSWKTLYVPIAVLLLGIVRCLFPVEFFGNRMIRSCKIYPFIEQAAKKKIGAGFTGENIFCLLWAAGAVLLSLRLFVQLCGQWKTVQRCALPKEHPLYDTCEHIAEELGFSYSGKIGISPDFSTAMMTGFLHPNILLPASAEKLSGEELDTVFRHELYHFRGRDLWIKLSMQFLCCLLWWNPAVYWLRNSADQVLELRCDRSVCRVMSEEERMAYSNALLRMLKHDKKSEYLLAAGYSGRGSRRNLRQRFNLILHEGKAKKYRLQTWVAVVISVLLFISSYLFILQPSYEHTPVSGEHAASGSDGDTFILRTGDGRLEYYRNSVRTGYLTEDMLEKEPYCYISVYEGY